jgi:dihydrofolate synthase/folylpolyglutamate synthase
LDAEEVFTLTRIAALLEAVGSPQVGKLFVHVTGSKGKGSTCAMLASALRGCGVSVGVFTSPHLTDLRERIGVDGEWITPEAFLSHARTLAKACAQLPAALGAFTAFELLTAMALLHFAQSKVEVGVVECGLGGLRDATNVVHAAVACVGEVQLEHTQILGDTKARIAMEKGGVYKAGAVALTIDQEKAVLDELSRCAEEAGAAGGLRVVGQQVPMEWRLEHSKERGAHYVVTVRGSSLTFENVPVPLLGQHQAVNCALALAALDALATGPFAGSAEAGEDAAAGVSVSPAKKKSSRGSARSASPGLPDAVEKLRGKLAKKLDVAGLVAGLSRTPNDGKMERVLREPKVYVDGAHTPDSILGIVRTIAAHLRQDSIVAVFGCAADKDIDGMLQALSMCADKVVFTTSGGPRSADPEALRARYTKLTGKPAQTAGNVRDGVNIAARAVAKNDVILITGSFAVAGEARRMFLEKFGAVKK